MINATMTFPDMIKSLNRPDECVIFSDDVESLFSVILEYDTIICIIHAE